MNKKGIDRPPTKRRPNILFFIVDELRFPTAYEDEHLKMWCKENLKTQEMLRKNGLEFLNHYVGSTACSPSRATLYTGQYPSLHGLTKTIGGAAESFEPDVFWLDPNTVPTFGDYFRQAGYKTFWKGKWHTSVADILIPGTHDSLQSYNPTTGVPDRKLEQVYLDANRLDDFGFSGWLGPEPHGSNPRNSASSAAIGTKGRDEVFAREAVELIQSLDRETNESKNQPWLIVSSFLNPHDITLFGELTEHSPLFNFEVDRTLPHIPPAPTAQESLDTKPTAQNSYRKTYPKTFQPTRDSLHYRQLYYSLQKQVDSEMGKVYDALKNSSFYEDTIVIFTSDHGDMLGAHGGLFQKWYNAYEESIHVPFIIHSPKLFPESKTTTMLTSHVDILPTLLGLADIDVKRTIKELSQNHSEVHPPVGRDLTPLLEGKSQFLRANEPVYFMTDDDVTRGLNQTSFTGDPYDSVIQPNHLETVIVYMQSGKQRKKELWKFTRYFDNPQFWSTPGTQDVVTTSLSEVPVADDQTITVSKVTTKTEPVPDQFELYNLTNDPLEEKNLADPTNAIVESKLVQSLLSNLLDEQRKQKRLTPTNS
ncbi:sulfatase-like hydrolase/transferase [Bacillus sinesaloumensis]|uniref:sulfatase-like hydrolase/transferase n=1 Tax=Litchfieldia sinesaloumensis TaxID=1926280 RepID=UPI001F409292|nr:sulfatase-like hydrolase/transferase [Bacillus sinesaloumensis]